MKQITKKNFSALKNIFHKNGPTWWFSTHKTSVLHSFGDVRVIPSLSRNVQLDTLRMQVKMRMNMIMMTITTTTTTTRTASTKKISIYFCVVLVIISEHLSGISIYPKQLCISDSVVKN